MLRQGRDVKSVADKLSSETLEQTRRMTPSERVDLALKLGRQAAEDLASARGITVDEAREVLRRNNQIGRRRSRSAAYDEQ